MDGLNGVDGIAGIQRVLNTPDGKHLYVLGPGLSGSEENKLAVFSRNAATGELTWIEVFEDGQGLVEGQEATTDLALSPDGKHLYVVSSSGEDALAYFTRNTTTRNLTWGGLLKDGDGTVDGLDNATGVAVSPDGKHVYVSAINDKSVSWFARDAGTGALTFIFEFSDVGSSELGQMFGLVVSGDGKNVYAINNSANKLLVFTRNADNGDLTLVQVITDRLNTVDGLGDPRHVAISSDHRHVHVAADDDNAVSMFSRNQTNGELSYVGLVTHQTGRFDGLLPVRDLAITPDGRYVAVAGTNKEVGLFERNADTGQLVYAGGMGDLPQETVSVLGTSADSRHLFVGRLNIGSLRVYELLRNPVFLPVVSR